MFGGDKTGISQLFVKHGEQTDHHPAIQQHLEKVEAIEVLDCTNCNDSPNKKQHLEIPQNPGAKWPWVALVQSNCPILRKEWVGTGQEYNTADQNQCKY